MSSGAIASVASPHSDAKASLRRVRRIVQLSFLGLWLALFLEARAQSLAFVPQDLFLFTDPLIAALTMGAAHVLIPSMAASLVLVALTLLLGRFFCGWVCPLGTLIDGAAKILRPAADRLSWQRHRAMQRWKYYVLTLLVVGALLSAQWVYLLDPLVLLFRGVTAGVYPAVVAWLPRGWVDEPLAIDYFGVAFAPLALLVAVLGLTAITPRFYCRYLCPLGAFYGLLARRTVLRRRVKGCDTCKSIGTDMQCVSGCRMGAVPQKPTRTQSHECIRCFSDRATCHRSAVGFEWLGPKLEKKDTTLDLDRRSFVVFGVTGAALAPMVTLSAYHRGDPKSVVRPPRVLDEQTFVDQCVRCSMCVQACPTQTLQPTHLEAGVAGFWTPAVTPSVGGCQAECNACSSVCPTGAIPTFSPAEADKWAAKMGTAVLEKGRCISHADNLACGKCLQACPTKAFVIEEASGAAPRRPASVIYERCVGCGLCEEACAKIVFGRPALVTSAHGRGQPTSLAMQPTASFVFPTKG